MHVNKQAHISTLYTKLLHICTCVRVGPMYVTHSFPLLLSLSFVYVYIYICVCVRACVCFICLFLWSVVLSFWALYLSLPSSQPKDVRFFEEHDPEREGVVDLDDFARAMFNMGAELSQAEAR